ncbi:Uma2 family endonuclease [Chondromyces crocatus]|uniref:Putative restriction endonuclease domain-containing protein n=1 Tax=Chondromyces crocatus TaxID=52 RepID=A0A0K1EJS9_CHOCO|nr:Uma2 family endonuclease [Chondromyces crocatus]AKT41116.1 uncharacterized protein CMC5_052770 [Chondromyces crocatus]
MGHLAEKRPAPATYADLEAVPPHLVAEIVDGVLHTLPRPAPAHAHASSELVFELSGPFGHGRGGPGGWRILMEPELHLGADVLVPDLAGWRLDRMPRLPRAAHFTQPPDWICEVLSPSTSAYDRAEKLPAYAAAGVSWAWLLDPLLHSLEVFHIGPRERWVLEHVFRGEAAVHAAPFDAIALDLAALWPDLEDDDTNP